MEEIPILFLVPMVFTFGIMVWIFLVLDKNGYSPGFDAWQNLKNFFAVIELAGKTKSKRKRMLYYFLPLAMVVGAILTFSLFFSAIRK